MQEMAFMTIKEEPIWDEDDAQSYEDVCKDQMEENKNSKADAECQIKIEQYEEINMEHEKIVVESLPPVESEESENDGDEEKVEEELKGKIACNEISLEECSYALKPAKEEKILPDDQDDFTYKSLVKSTRQQKSPTVKCRRCKRMFSSPVHRKRICDTCSSEMHKCPECKKCFKYKKNLNVHVLGVHRSSEVFECPTCHRHFRYKRNLSMHLEQMHGTHKPYRCGVCSMCFGKKSSLVRHFRTHTGEKPFICHICNHSFTLKGSLVNHIRMHTGEKPYSCSLCEKSFAKKSDLVRHIRVHTGDRPYDCKICKHSFSQKMNLVRHLRIHTGEK